MCSLAHASSTPAGFGSWTQQLKRLHHDTQVKRAADLFSQVRRAGPGHGEPRLRHWLPKPGAALCRHGQLVEVLRVTLSLSGMGDTVSSYLLSNRPCGPLSNPPIGIVHIDLELQRR